MGTEDAPAPSGGPAAHSQVPNQQVPNPQAPYPQAPYPQAPYPQAPYPQNAGQPAGYSQGPYATGPYQYPYSGQGYPWYAYQQPAEPPKRSRGLRAFLIALPIAIILAGGGITIAIVTHHSKPTLTASNLPTDSGQRSGMDRFILPKTLDSLPMNNTAQTAQAEQMLQNMIGALGGGTPVLGVYGGASDPAKMLELIGAPAPIPDVSTEVAGFFQGFTATSGVDFGTPNSYDPGSMGGQMQCAAATATDVAGDARLVAACVVGDSGGLMAVIGTGYDETEIVQLTQSIRPAFEKQ